MYFLVHEDVPAQQGIRLPLKFFAVTQEDHSTFIPPLYHPEPDDPARIAMYPKDKVYAEMINNKEYSIEEIRARRYLNQQRLSSSRLVVGPTETQQAVQSIVGEVMQADDEEDRVKIDLGIHNNQHLSMQEIQERYMLYKKKLHETI